MRLTATLNCSFDAKARPGTRDRRRGGGASIQAIRIVLDRVSPEEHGGSVSELLEVCHVSSASKAALAELASARIPRWFGDSATPLLYMRFHDDVLSGPSLNRRPTPVVPAAASGHVCDGLPTFVPASFTSA